VSNKIETQIKIVGVMQRANNPLILNHIAKRARIAPQLVDYHLEQMIKKGIAYLHTDENGNKYYMLQPIFYDKNWTYALSNQLIPFIQEMSKPGMLVFDQADEKTSVERLIINVFVTFLKRFEEEVEKLDWLHSKLSLKNI